MKPKFKRIEIPGERERQYPKGYMYFIYAPEGNFLLTGANGKTIEDYIEDHFPICIYRWACWNKGESRGMWIGRHPRLKIYVTERREVRDFMDLRPRKLTNKITVQFKNYQEGRLRQQVTLTYRRMPNKWIPEWTNAINGATWLWNC
jgi:hypothetical protein